MEFKINFAFIVCIFFVVIFTISLIDEIVKAIRNKRKKDVSDRAFGNLADFIDCFQKRFLVKEHGFTVAQLEGKISDDLCNECGHKDACALGFFPKCLEMDENSIDKYKTT